MTRFNKSEHALTVDDEVQKDRATIRDMARTPSRAAPRLTLLLRQMEEELGGIRGARATIARRTTLDPAVVSDFLNDKRDNVKGEIIDRVCDKMNIDPDFFYKPWPEGQDRHYKDFPAKRNRSGAVQQRRSADVDDNDATDASDDDVLDELRPTPDELSALQSHLQKYRYPRVDGSIKRAFILGMRQRRVQPAMDAAVNEMAKDMAHEPPSPKRVR